MTPAIITLLSVILAALLGSGGIYLWGPQRRKLAIDSMTIVVEQLQKQYDRVSEELAQLQIETVEWKHEQENCRITIAELKMDLKFLRRDFDITRNRAHIAINAIGGYEVLIDDILAELREHKIPIKPMLRPQKLRAAFQTEMKRLDALEVEITEEKLKAAPPEDTGMSETV